MSRNLGFGWNNSIAASLDRADFNVYLECTDCDGTDWKPGEQVKTHDEDFVESYRYLLRGCTLQTGLYRSYHSSPSHLLVETERHWRARPPRSALLACVLRHRPQDSKVFAVHAIAEMRVVLFVHDQVRVVLPRFRNCVVELNDMDIAGDWGELVLVLDLLDDLGLIQADFLSESLAIVRGQRTKAMVAATEAGAITKH